MERMYVVLVGLFVALVWGGGDAQTRTATPASTEPSRPASAGIDRSIGDRRDEPRWPFATIDDYCEHVLCELTPPEPS
jgi:hypothetical protein